MLGHWDIAVFHFINTTLANPFLDTLMPLVTKLGSSEFVIILAVLLIVLGKRDKTLAGILLLAGLTLTYFTVETLKTTFMLPRPFVSIADVRLLVPQSSIYSFPSGHSITAFMAATIVSRYLNNYIAWLIVSSLVAFSRVYVGVHYVSDVIAGAFIGIAIGFGLVKIADRIKSN